MNDVRDDPIPRVVMGFSFSSIRRVALLYILVIHFLPAVVSRPARSEPIFFDQTTAQRLLGQHDLFQGDHHPAGHVAMGTACNVEIVSWLGDLKLIEKNGRHVVVEMLARVHHDLGDFA